MNIHGVGLPQASVQFIEQLAADEGMTIKKILRVGKRFFVADVLFRGERALFKTCVESQSRDPWTNRKFSREILFLQFLVGSRHRTARIFAPTIYRGSTQNRAWYIREYLHGTFYNINNGNIRFRTSFFTDAHRHAIVRSFRDLQHITKAELPMSIRHHLRRYDQTPTIHALLDPNWKHIARHLGDASAARHLPKILNERARVFDRVPAVLAHQEPYASHFVQIRGVLHLIDWENIAWANPLHDYTNLWMRSDARPQWQEALRQDARRTTRHLLKKDFDATWHTNLVIKSLFNVLSFPSYPKKADFRALHALSRRIVQQELKTWRAKNL